MEQPQKYAIHMEKRRAVASLVWELEHMSFTCKTDVAPLRDEFLRLQSLQDEVIAAAKIWLETDVVIVNSQVKAQTLHETISLYAMLKEQANVTTAEAWTRMSLSWKIFLYSIRCFQDCVYKAILYAQAQPVGRNASMVTCISKGNWRGDAGVGKLIVTHLPAYPEWFMRMRNLRNELKKGLSVQSKWEDHEHFIVLCEQRWDGDYINNVAEYPLKFDFAVESLAMCKGIAELIPVAVRETHARKEERKRRIEQDEAGSPSLDDSPPANPI